MIAGVVRLLFWLGVLVVALWLWTFVVDATRADCQRRGGTFVQVGTQVGCIEGGHK